MGPGTHLVSSLCINGASMHARLGFGHRSEHSIQLLEVRKTHFRVDGRYSSLWPNSAKPFTEIAETGSVTSGNMQHRPTMTPDLLVAQLPLRRVQKCSVFLRFQRSNWYTDDTALWEKTRTPKAGWSAPIPPLVLSLTFFLSSAAFFYPPFDTILAPMATLPLSTVILYTEYLWHIVACRMYCGASQECHGT